MNLGFALLHGRAQQLTAIILQHDFFCFRSGWQLHEADFTRFETSRSGIFSSRGLKCEIEKRNERLMHRPGGVLPIHAKGQHE